VLFHERMTADRTRAGETKRDRLTDVALSRSRQIPLPRKLPLRVKIGSRASLTRRKRHQATPFIRDLLARDQHDPTIIEMSKLRSKRAKSDVHATWLKSPRT
jgi:hypothetical protein